MNDGLDLFLHGLGLAEPPETAVPDADHQLFLAGEAAVALAATLPEARPSSGLRARILQSVAKPNPGLGTVRASEGKWKPTAEPGITFKKLYFDRDAGLVTMLVRLEPGAVYPAHTHSRTEQCLVLEGDLIHQDRVYGPGDFTWAEAGSADPALTTRNGTLLLIIAAPEKRPDGSAGVAL